MKPFKVCDRHRIPVRLYTEEQYNTHMRNVHHGTWLAMIQEKKNRDRVMRQLSPEVQAEKWKEYYGDLPSP